jgi:hypothetical protein|tara:strand:+ start:177 stop:434 length:258 start_codon:yes stop_codon:yes gene_type:complete
MEREIRNRIRRQLRLQGRNPNTVSNRDIERMRQMELEKLIPKELGGAQSGNSISDSDIEKLRQMKEYMDKNDGGSRRSPRDTIVT